MNNQGTLAKLGEMKLHGMTRAFRATMETGLKQNFSADELVAHLVDTEWDDRKNKKVNRLARIARFRYQASLEEIDFAHPRKLDRNQILRLSNCTWVKNGEAVILTGKTGLGKSFIATALGMQGCCFGFKTLYFNCGKLFSMLKMAHADGTYPKLIKRFAKTDIIILDDFGLHRFDLESRLTLLEILEDRHGRKSTIIATQFPTNKWHDVIGDPTIADAICDRLIHTAHRIELDGKSMRDPKNKKEEKNEKNH